MAGFILGLLLGIVGKSIYDLFQEEQLPSGLGINTGRMEALMDETRQIVRELRSEVEQVLDGARASAHEKVGRLAAAAVASEPEAEAPGSPKKSAAQKREPSDQASEASEGAKAP